MTCLWRNVLPLRTPGWPTTQLGNVSGSGFLMEATPFPGNSQDKARGGSQDKPTLSHPQPAHSQLVCCSATLGRQKREQREQVTVSGSRAGSRGLSSSAAQRREHQPSTIPPFPAPNHPLTTEAGVTPFAPHPPAPLTRERAAHGHLLLGQHLACRSPLGVTNACSPSRRRPCPGTRWVSRLPGGPWGGVPRAMVPASLGCLTLC